MPKTKKQSVEKRRKLQKLLKQLRDEEKKAISKNDTSKLESALKSAANLVATDTIGTPRDTQEDSKDESKEKRKISTKIRIRNIRKDNSYKKNENEATKQRMRKIRNSDVEYKAKEKEVNKNRIKVLRDTDDEYAVNEKEANKKRIQVLRDTDAEYAVNEKEANKKRIQVLRDTNEEYVVNEKQANKKRIQVLRDTDGEYAVNEKEANKKRIQVLRDTDAAYALNEKEANKKRIQVLRDTDEEYAVNEKEANKKRIQVLRDTDSAYAVKEKEANKKRIQVLRDTDEEYAVKEKEANKKRIRVLRDTDEGYVLGEREANQRRLKVIRSTDQQYKAWENEGNKVRIETIRKNEAYKKAEREKDRIRKQNETRERHLTNILNNIQIMSNNPGHEKFFSLIKEGPTEICTCCHRLWFPRNCRFVFKQFIIAKYGEAFWKTIFGECNDETCFVCSSCYGTIYGGKVPQLCHFNYDIIFPIPPVLQSLSVLEERLISPRLPFMQIRRLGYDRQCSIKGQVVNVPVSVDTMVNVLPRNMNDTGTIQLKLKRKIDYQQDHFCETIRPAIVIQAAQYLIDQPLYKELKISLSDQWQQSVQVASQADLSDDHLSLASDNLEQELNEIFKEFERDDFFDDINPGGEQTLLDNDVLENIALAPGENKRPIHLMSDTYAEELSFPTIFGGNKKVFRVKVSYSDIAKLQASHKDRRFARTDFLLYSYKKHILFLVISKASFAIRQKLNKDIRYTAQQVRSSDFLAGLVQHDGGFNFLQSISSAPVYWQKQKRKLMSMIRQFNIPTLFLTVSAAETMWAELLVVLTKVVDKKFISEEEALSLPHKEKARLIRSDPITCARYFDNRFKLLFSHMKSQDGPFSEHPIVYSYYRIEFQHRGSPHVHSLLWLKDAPKCDFENADSVAQSEEFIGKYITCDSSLEKTAALVPYQTHHHSKSCKRSFQNVISCRYGVPFLPMDKVTILTPIKNNKKDTTVSGKFIEIKKYLNDNRDVEVSMSDFLGSLSLTKEQYIEVIRKNITKPMVCLKRSVKDCFVNPFNEEILSMMRSNMDIQFILDPYACCSYIINYINKTHRGVSKLMKEAMGQIKSGNTDIKDQLLKLGNVFMNASEISAQEAAYTLLKLHMSETSNQEVYISTLPPEQRLKVLKSKRNLEALAGDDPDIYEKNLLDHYVVRPAALEDVCLAEFAAFYQFKKYDEKAHKDKGFLECLDRSGILVKRRQVKVLTFNKYGLQQDPLNFYRQQLMLYSHWRDEEKELLHVDQEQLYLAMYEQIKENRKKFDLLDMALLDEAYENAQNNLESILVDEDPENERDPEYLPYGLDDPTALDVFDGIVQANPKDTTEKRSFPTPFQINDEEYNQLISTLNEKQYEYLTHVLGKVRENSPFYEIVSGGAGVGKSRLINAIYQSILRHFNSIPGNNPETVKVLLTAPTGKASFNINGMTLHSVLSLPVNQYGGPLIPISNDLVNSLYTKLADLKVLVIDEFSMVGARMFDNINSRLKQIFKSKVDFAGITVILVGDLRQLPPVGDRWIFLPSSTDPYAEITGRQLWDKFAFFELTEIMRQRDDKKFAVALNHLAIGEMTADDVALFKSRETKVHDNLPETTIHLFKSNNEVDEFNLFKLNQFPTERAISKAVDMVKGSCNDRTKSKLLKQAQSLKKSESFGLMLELVLQVGAKYMVSRNLNVEDGLVNGATGILRKIVKTQDGTAKTVWMEFSEARVGRETRKKFQAIMVLESVPETWTPIEKIAKPIDFQKGTNVTVERKQFPLLIAEGITIHKSQGSTYTQVAVHLQKSMARNALYVACSRATNLSGLYIFGTFQAPRKPSSSDKSHSEVQNLRQNKVLITSLRRHIVEERGKITIGYQNIQSFNKHLNFVKNNPLFMWSDILLFVETWVNSRDNVDIQGYQCFSNICNPNLHKPFGILCYNKPNVPVKLLKEVKEVHAFHTFQSVVFNMVDTTVLVVYVPPKFPIRKAADILVNLLNDIDNDCLVLGDFNCDMSVSENNQLVSALRSKGFESKLKSTSSTTKASTYIDWCFSNSNTIKCALFDTVYSFHRTISVNVYENDAPEDMSCEEDDQNSDRAPSVQPRSLNNSFDDVVADSSSQSSIDANEDMDPLGSQNNTVENTTCQGEIYTHKGLLNADAVSCYSNSTIQCLFSLPEFRVSVDRANTEINVEIKRVMLQELNHTRLIRSKVDDCFTESRQQDVHEFISLLFNKLDDDFLQYLVFSGADERYCARCDTRDIVNVQENQRFHLIHFPESGQNQILFNDLIDLQETEIPCRTCSSSVKSKSVLQEVNKYVFVVFLRYQYGVNGPTKIMTKITGLNPQRIQIDGHNFRIKCVIKHLGPQVSSGHYIANIAQTNGKWLQCNDNVVSELNRFDDNLEDVYMAILEKII